MSNKPLTEKQVQAMFDADEERRDQVKKIP